MRSYKQLGLKYFKYQRKRAYIIIASLLLSSCFFYIMITLLINTLGDKYRYEKESGDYDAIFYELSDAQYDTIKNYATISSAKKAYEDEICFTGFRGATPENMGYISREIRHIYLDTMNDSILSYEMIEGRAPENEREILLSESVVNSFEKKPSVGDKIKPILEGEDSSYYEGEAFTICGIIKLDYETYINTYPTAISLAPKDMKLDTYVSFKKKFTIAEGCLTWYNYCKKIESSLGLKEIERYGGRMNPFTINSTLGFFYLQDREGLITALAVICLDIFILIIYIASVMVRSIFSANLVDKLKDFSMLKAIGADNRHIKKIFSVECYLECTISFFLSIALGHLIMSVLLKDILKLNTISTGFSLAAFLLTLVFSFATVTIAIIEPLMFFKKISVVDGIRSHYMGKEIKIKKDNAGLFKLFGTEAIYAYKNAKRNRRGFSNAVASLSISLIIVIILAGGIKAIGKQSSNDLIYQNGNYNSYVFSDIKLKNPDNIYSFLRSKPYIKRLQRTYGFDAFPSYTKAPKVDGETLMNVNDCPIINLKICDEAELNDLSQCIGKDANKLLSDGGCILVNTRMVYPEEDVPEDKREASLVKTFDLKENDKLTIPRISFLVEIEQSGNDTFFFSNESIKNGSAPKEDLTIKAIAEGKINGFLSNFPTVIMSKHFFDDQYDKDVTDMLFKSIIMELDDNNFNEDELSTELLSKFGCQFSWLDYNYELNREFRGYRIAGTFVAIYIFILGIMSIVNNMVTDTFVRRKEFASLRAIGMSKKQLNKMLTFEKLEIGLTAWFIAILLTTLFIAPILYIYNTILENGLLFSTLPIPWSVLLLGGIVLILIMLILARLAIKKADEMDITSELRSEA